MDDVAILIPAYDPDEKLVALVDDLRPLFRHLVLVDDGSTRGRDVLDAVRGRVEALLAHDVNRGKGVALRTGLAWIRANLPSVRTVVTADSDGQHRPADIRRVAEASLGYPDGLVLGVRAFAGKVPFRSQLGNVWTRILFRLLTGLPVRDTQTGLRGLPRTLFDDLLKRPGDRYEYEIRMLVAARRHPAPPLQIPIETVYIEGNRSSHFRPLKDTFATQGALLAARLGW